jgi:hypothetical protein
MTPAGSRTQLIRILIALCSMAGLLCLASLSWGGPAAAESPPGVAQDLKPTSTPWVPESTGEIPRLCGELVYLLDKQSEVKDIGLKACNSSKIYIFYRHPRDLVRFYQFRDADVGTGQELCDKQYGCLDNYLIDFKNYVGLESCDDCGNRMLPTWTAVPLTPYTPTSPPPTPTEYRPSPSATFTPTLAPYQATETANLFELLYGTPSETHVPPTAPLTAPASPTLSATPAPPASGIARLTRSPLFLGLVFLIFGLLLAYLAWLSVSRPRGE